MARHGMVRLGVEWLGMARHGEARRGKAWQGVWRNYKPPLKIK